MNENARNAVEARRHQPLREAAKGRLNTLATFPEGTFLENLVVRVDNSLLVSSLKARQIWHIAPAVSPEEEVRPELLFEFEQSPMSFVELEPDVFYLCTSDGYITHASNLYRIDLRGWKAGRRSHRSWSSPFRLRCAR